MQIVKMFSVIKGVECKYDVIRGKTFDSSEILDSSRLRQDDNK